MKNSEAAIHDSKNHASYSGSVNSSSSLKLKYAILTVETCKTQSERGRAAETTPTEQIRRQTIEKHARDGLPGLVLAFERVEENNERENEQKCVENDADSRHNAIRVHLRADMSCNTSRKKQNLKYSVARRGRKTEDRKSYRTSASAEVDAQRLVSENRKN